MKYGEEVGAEGTPHLQGVVCFKGPISFQCALKKLDGCHVEVCRSLAASVEYVAKDGVVTERGVKPMSQSEKGKRGKEYWDNVLELARADRIHEIDSSVQLSHGVALRL